MKRLHIDDKPVEIEFDLTGDRLWSKAFVIGQTLTGRRARVAQITLPTLFLKQQSGAVFTGGHRYHFKEVPV